LKTITKKNDDPKDEVVESSDSENLNLLVKRFGKYIKKKGNKGNSRGTLPNEMSQILLISLVIIVGSKDISRLNVQMLTKRKRRVLIGKRRRNQGRDVHT